MNVGVHLLWKTLDTVNAERGLRFLPDTTLEDCPKELDDVRFELRGVRCGLPTTQESGRFFDRRHCRELLNERIGLKSSFENSHSASSLDNR